MRGARYPKYKPTGIAWLPEVPEGWDVRPLKEMASCNDEAISESDTPIDAEIHYVEIGDVEFASGISNVSSMKFGDAPSRARRKTRVGDIIVSTVRTYLRAVAKIVHDDLIVSTGFAVLRPKTVSSDYLSYACVSSSFTDQVIAESTGISYPAISSSKLMRCRIPLPPLPIQRAIVAFLDGKCGKIDRWVAAKEREGALLKELKQAMIAEAVTGATHVARTDTARKMKPSGIPWLPEVPEGWKVKRVATLLKIKDCPSAPNEELLSVFLDRGVIRFSEGGEKRANATSKDLSRYQLVEVDDFVMNNQQAWRGSVGISRYRGIVSPAYFVVRLADCIDSKYAEYAFRSRPFVGVYELCSRGVGSIQRNLIWNMFKQQHLPLPPPAEQRAIVAYIEARAAKIDAAVAGLEREVAAMKEYKQRLIADVVTGQKKVA